MAQKERKLTAEDVELIELAFPTMSDVEKRRVLPLLKEYKDNLTQEIAKDSFLDFIQHVYPD